MHRRIVAGNGLKGPGTRMLVFKAPNKLISLRLLPKTHLFGHLDPQGTSEQEEDLRRMCPNIEEAF